MKPRKTWVTILALLLSPAAFVLLLVGLHAAGATHSAPPQPGVTAPGPTPLPSPTAPSSGTLVFDDEFSGELNTTTWAVLNRQGDAGNNELECYLPSNAAVGGGVLVLTTRVDSSACPLGHYSSAMVQWRTWNFQYGTIVIRAKEAGGTGTWPALWLLGAVCQAGNITDANDPNCHWPQPGSDEIDIAEIMHGDLSHVGEYLHSGSTNSGCQPTSSDVSQNWHTYSLVWQPGSLTFKIDGAVTCTTTSSIPSHPMFLIMNTAVGGNGGGSVNDRTLPQTHSIDYVRVYR